MVGAIVNSCTSWTGNYWRDRCGGRQICLGFGPWGLTGIIGFCCPFTYVLFSQDSQWWSPRILFSECRTHSAFALAWCQPLHW